MPRFRHGKLMGFHARCPGGDSGRLGRRLYGRAGHGRSTASTSSSTARRCRSTASTRPRSTRPAWNGAVRARSAIPAASTPRRSWQASRRLARFRLRQGGRRRCRPGHLLCRRPGCGRGHGGSRLGRCLRLCEPLCAGGDTARARRASVCGRGTSNWPANAKRPTCRMETTHPPPTICRRRRNSSRSLKS